MRLLHASLPAASAAFAAVSPGEITPTKKAPFVPPAVAARGELVDAIKASKRFAAEPNMGPFEQLATSVVLTRARGWGPLRETLRSYASDAAPKGATKEQLQSLFALRYGKAAKADVGACFEKMGYHLEPDAKSVLEGSPAFKPTLPSSAK